MAPISYPSLALVFAASENAFFESDLQACRKLSHFKAWIEIPSHTLYDLLICLSGVNTIKTDRPNNILYCSRGLAWVTKRARRPRQLERIQEVASSTGPLCLQHTRHLSIFLGHNFIVPHDFYPHVEYSCTLTNPKGNPRPHSPYTQWRSPLQYQDYPTPR